MRIFQLMLVITCTIVYCQANPLRLLSFNTRLAPDEVHVESRLSRIIQKVRKSEADVLCLQEVWYDDHFFALVEALEWRYPFSYSFLHDESGLLGEKLDMPGSKCSLEEEKRILKCAEQSCSNVKDGEEFNFCFINECNPFDLHLNDACTECTSLQLEACIKSAPQEWNIKKMIKCIERINSTRGVCSSRTASNKANHGLVMLSNMPFTSQKRGLFSKSSLIPRGFLEVKNNFGETFTCTHMTPGRSSVYTEIKTPFSNWYDLKENEVEQLINRYSQSKQTFILGNFNIGPALPGHGIHAYYPDLYKTMEDRGLENIIAREAGKCTLCAQNTLAKDEISNSYIVDGCIPVNVDRCRLSNEVVFMEKVLMNPISRRNYPLSEHYATLSSFCDNLELFLTNSDDGSGSGYI